MTQINEPPNSHLFSEDWISTIVGVVIHPISLIYDFTLYKTMVASGRC